MMRRLRRVYHGAPHLLRAAVSGLLPFADPISALHWELGIPRDYASRGMPRHHPPPDLIRCDGHLMTPETRDHWLRMRHDAEQQGAVLRLQAAFRSVNEQKLLVRDAIRRGKSIDEILKRIAAPGYSEHHTGRALDIVSESCSGPRFERTIEYEWLCKYAGNYGFVQTYPRGNPYGVMFEPWHWCWRPPAHPPGP